MFFQTKPALPIVSAGSSPGRGWGRGPWSGGTRGMWDTHMQWHTETVARLLNVWISQGSPYSPAFVVAVKSSHSAFD